jgi:hypothetical protein
MWFSRGSFATIPVSGVRCLLHGRADAAGVEVTRRLASFLERCRGFRQLDVHMAAYSRYGEDVQDLRDEWNRQVSALVAAGIVVRAESLPLAASSEPVFPPLGHTGIPTAGRPGRLARCLTSFADHARVHGRTMRFFVADDSRDPEMARLNEDLCAAQSAVYLGPVEKEKLRKDLARRSRVDPEVVDFGLADPLGVGFTCGANRNWLLLAHEGRRFTFLDDDTVCRLHIPSGAPVGWQWMNRGSAYEFTYFSSREEVEALPQADGVDFWSGQDHWLGRPLGAWADRPPAGMENLDWAASGLHEEVAARVALVAHGIHGVPPVRGSHYMLQLRGASRDRLRAQDAELLQRMRHGELLMGVHRATLAPPTNLPGPAMALDASAAMPPFIPAFHGEDAVYAGLCLALAPHFWVMHLPWSVRHDPGHRPDLIPPGVEYPENHFHHHEVHTLLRAFLEDLPRRAAATNVEQRLRQIGQTLEEVGGWPAADFQEQMVDLTLRRVTRGLASYYQAADECNSAHPVQAGLLRDRIRQIEHNLRNPGAVLPAEIALTRGEGEGWILLQRLVRSYGRLISAWPALREAARAMADEGGFGRGCQG